MKKIKLAPSAYLRAMLALAGQALSEFHQHVALHHRGKGRGSPNRKYGNKPGKYLPHQGKRERARRLLP